MIAVGITGSTGMGKTAAAKAFARRGYPVFDADAEVRRLLSEDGRTIVAVRKAFPEAWDGQTIDRLRLAATVFANTSALGRLEAILHPKVRTAERAFLRAAKRTGARLAVLEVPLLFETGSERLCDVVLVVSAPRKVQEARVLARPGMTRRRLAAMRARQLSDLEKRRQADYVVDTSGPKPKMLRELAKIIRTLDPPRPRKPAARS